MPSRDRGSTTLLAPSSERSACRERLIRYTYSNIELSVISNPLNSTQLRHVSESYEPMEVPFEKDNKEEERNEGDNHTVEKL